VNRNFEDSKMKSVDFDQVLVIFKNRCIILCAYYRSWIFEI